MSVILNRGTKARKWGLSILAAILVLIVGAILGFQAAVGLLKGKVLEALGPDGEVKELRVRWSGVELAGLRIKARQGWPAADTLRAERVVIVPSLKSLLSEGDINNPRFALNEAFATRLATGLAENLGVSIRGVAEGVGTFGQKGLEAAGEAAKGVGSALQQLLGGQKKR